jgi:hypothetical protein
MNKEFIPYEQALELKELGFNEQCFAAQKDNIIDYGSEMHSFIYNMDCGDIWVALPLYQQAFRWFREKYGIMYTVDNNIIGNTFHGSYTKINSDYQSDYTDDFATYEEAELACLKKLIEIVKNK